MQIIQNWAWCLYPLAAEQDHQDRDDGADDRRDGERVERRGAPDPGADAGEQLHVARAHAADRVGRQQQREADDRAEHAVHQAFPTGVRRQRGAVDPAGDDHRERDPVRYFQFQAVDDGGDDQCQRDDPNWPVVEQAAGEVMNVEHV